MEEAGGEGMEEEGVEEAGELKTNGDGGSSKRGNRRSKGEGMEEAAREQMEEAREWGCRKQGELMEKEAVREVIEGERGWTKQGERI